MASNAVGLVNILKDEYKKFTKEVRHYNDDGDNSKAIENINNYLKIFKCCMYGLVLTIAGTKTSETEDPSESMHILNLEKYFGDFSDINAIASNKDIRKALKKLSKIKRGQTIQNEINIIRENVLSNFSGYTKSMIPSTPLKASKSPKKSNLSIVPQVSFDKIFEQFTVFISCLYEIYSDIEPVGLKELCECMSKFMESFDSKSDGISTPRKRSTIKEESNAICTMINSVVDELIKKLIDDDDDENDNNDKVVNDENDNDDKVVNDDNDKVDKDDNNKNDIINEDKVDENSDKEKEKEIKEERNKVSDDDIKYDSSESGTDTRRTSGEMFLHSRNMQKDDTQEAFIDRTNNKEINLIIKSIINNPEKLDEITDIDTLKNIIMRLIKITKKRHAAYKSLKRLKTGVGNNNDDAKSCDSDDTVIALMIPASLTSPRTPKKTLKKAEKAQPRETSIADGNSSIAATPEKLPGYDDNEHDFENPPDYEDNNNHTLIRAYSERIDGSKSNIGPISRSNSESIVPRKNSLKKVGKEIPKSLTKSTIVIIIRYENDRVFHLNPVVVESLMNEDKQKNGAEFLCSSLYIYLMDRFITSKIDIPQKYQTKSLLEAVRVQHSTVISVFHNFISHALTSVFRISAILNSKDVTRISSTAESIQKDLLIIEDLLCELFIEIIRECYNAIWVECPIDTNDLVSSIIGGIKSGKVFKKYSWYDKYASRVVRSQWDKKYIIKAFTKNIMQNITRLFNSITPFVRLICDLPSCSEKFSIGTAYETIAWGISLVSLINKIYIAHDAIVKLVSEPDYPLPVGKPHEKKGRIKYLRKISGTSKLTLYDELKIEADILKSGIYDLEGENGFPKRVSLNKIIAIATDPSTDKVVREEMVRVIVDTPFLISKNHYSILVSLIDRFCVPDSYAKKYNPEYINKIKSNTVNVIRGWVFAQIENIDDFLVTVLDEFINEVIQSSPSEGNILSDVFYSCKHLREKRSELSVLPSIRGFDLDYTIYSFQSIFEEYKPEIIAGQMTLASFDLFKKITFNELYYGAINDNYYEYAYPNMTRFIEHQDCIISCVGLYIISKKTAEEKGRAWKKIVDIMESLEKYNNFADLFCLYTSCQNLCDIKGFKHSSFMKRMNELFMTHFVKYKEVYDKTPLPKVPLVIAHVIQALRTNEKRKLMEDVDKDHLSRKLHDVEQIDFDDARKAYKLLECIWSARKSVYKINKNPFLYRIFYDPPRFIQSEIDFWKLKTIKERKAKYSSLRTEVVKKKGK